MWYVLMEKAHWVLLRCNATWPKIEFIVSLSLRISINFSHHATIVFIVSSNWDISGIIQSIVQSERENNTAGWFQMSITIETSMYERNFILHCKATMIFLKKRCQRCFIDVGCWETRNREMLCVNWSVKESLAWINTTNITENVCLSSSLGVETTSSNSSRVNLNHILWESNK